MKKTKVTTSFEFLGEYFAITKHLGSNVIEIAELVDKRFGGTEYKRIYFGHIVPLKEAIRFFEKVDENT